MQKGAKLYIKSLPLQPDPIIMWLSGTISAVFNILLTLVNQVKLFNVTSIRVDPRKAHADTTDLTDTAFGFSVIHFKGSISCFMNVECFT